MIAEMGLESKKSTTEAFSWYLKAAYLGDVKAQYKVADAYNTGSGTEKDQVKAQEWFKKAAVQGNTLAQASLRE